MSEKLALDIDTAVKAISDKAYAVALAHIRDNRAAIDKIVEVLLEKETMSGDEFRALLSEFTEIPVENRVPAAKSQPVAAWIWSFMYIITLVNYSKTDQIILLFEDMAMGWDV